jgi:cytochrome c-type biogenesis protein CcmH
MVRSTGYLTLLLLAFLAGSPLRAVQVDEILADPALERRARAISHDLRCMVCQNQSIDDSEAPLARDLRLLVRERLRAGDSDRQVIDFMVARYGEFVLLKPRLAWHTVILWAAPLLALLAGLAATLHAMRRRSGLVVAEPARLTEAEQAKLVAIERSQGSV